LHLVEGGLSRFHESKDLLNCEFAFDSDDEKVGLGWEIEDDARGWIEAILITSLIIASDYGYIAILGICMVFIYTWRNKRKWRVVVEFNIYMGPGIIYEFINYNTPLVKSIW